MAVEEIYQFLKEHKGVYYSAKQIAEQLGLSQQTTSRSLNVISRYADISCEYKKLDIRSLNRLLQLATKQSWVYAYVKNKRS